MVLCNDEALHHPAKTRLTGDGSENNSKAKYDRVWGDRDRVIPGAKGTLEGFPQ